MENQNQNQKYTDEQYLNIEYFEGDDEHTHNEYKIIKKTRKEHTCVTIHKDTHPIPVGSKAIRETAIHIDNGRVSCYLCIDCANDYLEEIYPELLDEDEE